MSADEKEMHMQTLKRDALVEAIRKMVMTLVDEEHSFCSVAGKLGIGCSGFHQYTDAELARRYRWIVKTRDPSTREELEDLANRWQLARQVVQDLPLSCDVQQIERDTCAGWDNFDDEQLASLYRTLTGTPHS